MINETLLDSYCEWVWYNVTENTTSTAFEVVLPNGTSDDDNLEYHLIYHIPEYNQMCLMKFEDLIISAIYYKIKRESFVNILFPYYILIVSLGLLGNCLSTCVFFGTKLRYSSPSVYLGALALSDNCYLIILLARRHLNLNTLILQKFFLFSIIFSACMSAWIMVIFTVERFIAIKWPLHRKSFCTVDRAKIVIIILTIVMFLVNIPIIAFIHDLKSGSAIYRICQTVITIIIPLLVITIYNILILYNISKSYRTRRNLTAMSITCSENRNYQNWMSQTKIFFVSFAFMFLNMPICVTRIILFSNLYGNSIESINITRDNDYTSVIYTLAIMRVIQVTNKLLFWARITMHIYYTNFAINFLLYCVSGKRFRKELVDMFKKSVNQLQNIYVHITNR